MLVLPEPGNPTGGVFSAADLQQIAYWCDKYDVLIVHDLSYSRWRARRESVGLARLPHAQGRTLYLGSFAKSHGLSSARVGWLIGSRHLLQPCALAAILNAPFVAPLCQQVALSALRSGQGAMTSLRDDFNARRVYVFDRLQQMGMRPWPNRAGFFFWVPMSGDARLFAQDLLTETGVLVNPGQPFGPSGKHFVRISFATDEGRLREGLARLEGFIRGEHRSSEQELEQPIRTMESVS